MRKPNKNDIPKAPKELVEAILSKKCVLFAGAGISRGKIMTKEGEKEQYLPTWEGLLTFLANEAQKSNYITNSQYRQLRKAAKNGKHLFVSETIRRKVGEKEFDDMLGSIFRSPTLMLTEKHKIITQIPFSAIVTTNYDKLIESAYAFINKSLPPIYTFDNSPDIVSALSSNRFFVLKAHGDIDRKETIILSERDYRDVVYRQPGYRAALNAIFIMKTVLFIGASLADPDIKLVLESVSESFTGKGPTHYALLPMKEAAIEEVRHWRDFFGIKILRYKATKGHPEIDFFLRELRDEVRSKSCKPEINADGEPLRYDQS